MRRPELYVPLSVKFATGRTGTAILEKYGLEGLAVWGAMLAASKVHQPAGRLTFYHDEDWASIGLAGHRPSFTLTEFLAFLGRRKQARTTRQGRTMYVQLTQWEHWNIAAKREAAARQKSRKRAESIPDTGPDMSSTENGHIPDLEKEKEIEKERTLAAPPRKRDELWDALSSELGEPLTESERGARNKALKELRVVGATAVDVKAKAAAYRKLWPSMTLTANALAKHWTMLAMPNGGDMGVRCPECDIILAGARTLAAHRANVHGVQAAA